MKRETVDIVEDLIAQLSIVVPFNSIVDNGDGSYTIESCNTGYLFPCYKFILDGVDYTVLNEVGKEFVFNSKFTIKGNVIPTATQVLLDGLKYYHGTVIATKEELARKELSSDKFPMAFLLEVLEDNFNNSDDARIDRVSKLRLFFLSETDENNWTTQEHYEFSIKPMRNLLDKFITYLDRSNLIGKVDSYKAINHAKFGVFVSEKGGHTKRIFNDKLSGVELFIDLPIRKLKDCDDCNTEVILECLPATITDSDGISTFEVLSGGIGACTPAVVQSGIQYQRDYFTYQVISYAAYDDAWQLANGGYNFTHPAIPLFIQELDLVTDPTGNTLLYNNAFGNKIRWTNASGVLATSTETYTIDNLTGLAYVRPTTTRSSYDNVFGIGGVLETLNTSGYNGHNDYFAPNGKIIMNISTFSFKVGDRAVLLPLMKFSIYEILTSTTYRLASTSVYDSNHITILSTVTKSSNSVFQNIYCRIHF